MHCPELAEANYLLLVLSMLPYLGKFPAHEELAKLMPRYLAVRHQEYIRK